MPISARSFNAKSRKNSADFRHAANFPKAPVDFHCKISQCEIHVDYKMMLVYTNDILIISHQFDTICIKVDIFTDDGQTT